MRFIKRKEVCDYCTAQFWVIPIFTYLSLKISQIPFNQYEWVWWVGVPVLIIIWVLINWKIKFKDDNV
jgi:hypothetical protein